MSQTTALVVTAHGTTDSLDELPAFLANIRRGRPAPPELIHEIRRRYEAIGGRSPMLEITRAQADAIGARLGIPARVATRMWEPYPARVLGELYAQGVRTFLSLPMAPYSVPIYNAAVDEAAAALPGPVTVLRAPDWNLAPGFVHALGVEIARALAAVPAGTNPALVVSAHSLPLRVVRGGDPYQTLFEQTARAAVESAGVSVPWRIAYQSQGASAEPWLGPDLPETFRALRDAGHDHVVVAPAGFVSDHIEVLYDLDIEARELARTMGLSFSRTATLNAAPALMDALADLARSLLGSPPR